MFHKGMVLQRVVAHIRPDSGCTSAVTSKVATGIGRRRACFTLPQCGFARRNLSRDRYDRFQAFWMCGKVVIAGVSADPRKICQKPLRARFSVAATIRHGFTYTFGPVLIDALGLPFSPVRKLFDVPLQQLSDTDWIGFAAGRATAQCRAQVHLQAGHLRTETTDSPFTNQLKKGEVLQIPIGHMEGVTSARRMNCTGWRPRIGSQFGTLRTAATLPRKRIRTDR
jgi:hypothetical protein